MTKRVLLMLTLALGVTLVACQEEDFPIDDGRDGGGIDDPWKGGGDDKGEDEDSDWDYDNDWGNDDTMHWGDDDDWGGEDTLEWDYDNDWGNDDSLPIDGWGGRGGNGKGRRP